MCSASAIMIPTEDILPKRPLSDVQFSSPIQIISLPPTSPDTSTDFSKPSSFPRVTGDLPPRFGNEPAVLGCATGEVRRMRSVLDMKLGAMAVSLEADLVTPEGASFFMEDDAVYSPPQTPPSKLPHIHAIDSPDHTPPLRSRDESHLAGMFDVFGIAIPRDTLAKIEREGTTEPVSCQTDDGWQFQVPRSSSSLSEGACSVVLAESPSRLDLSALLC